jgi:phosphopantetheine--protein transferase-like protein
MTALAECRKQYALRSDLRRLRGPASEEWLSAGERETFSRLHDSDRREGWLWGRILGKELIREQFSDDAADLRSIEIISQGADGRGMRPHVAIDGRPQACSLSISHSQQAILVAICAAPGTCVGVDIVDVVRYRSGFLETFFSADEREWLSQDQPERIAAAWAVKESVYKACNAGEGFTPRRICVRPLQSGCYTCTYNEFDLSGVCDIQTWQTADQVAALATVAVEQLSNRTGAYETRSNASV